MQQTVAKSFQHSLSALSIFVNEQENMAKVAAIADRLAAAFRAGRKVIIAGNGGSACDAAHFAEEFTCKFRLDRKPLPVIALVEPSHILATGNDFGFEQVFARGVEAFGQPGDIFIGISTSGNSPNVIAALSKARELGLVTVAFLGRDGGRAKGLADLELIVRGDTADKIQEVHMTTLHILIEGVERALFPENYR